MIDVLLTSDVSYMIDILLTSDVSHMIDILLTSGVSLMVDVLFASDFSAEKAQDWCMNRIHPETVFDHPILRNNKELKKFYFGQN